MRTRRQRLESEVEHLTSSVVRCVHSQFNAYNICSSPLSKNTNVIELYHLLEKDENQITFYNSGIGTYATPSWKSWAYRRQQFDHTVDLAIAWCVIFLSSRTKALHPAVISVIHRNFERIVQIAYQWLSEQYREGDKIFLFGTCGCRLSFNIV